MPAREASQRDSTNAIFRASRWRVPCYPGEPDLGADRGVDGRNVPAVLSGAAGGPLLLANVRTNEGAAGEGGSLVRLASQVRLPASEADQAHHVLPPQ
jgi:hypothetical protein